MRRNDGERGQRSGGGDPRHTSRHGERDYGGEGGYYGRETRGGGESSRQPGGRYDEGSPSAQRGGFGDYEGERPEAGGGYYGNRPGERSSDSRRGYDERGGYEPGDGPDYGGRGREYRSDTGGPQRYATGYPYGLREGAGTASPYDAARDDGRRDQGARDAGTHRGRGPKNYARSDERIREDLSERLSDDPHIDAGDIDVEVKDGVVTLTGTVDSRPVKHRVEDLADRCGGVKDVQNRIAVRRAGADAGSLVGQGAAERATPAARGDGEGGQQH